MATGFYIPDGRDFSSIFTAGNAGFTSGFKQANGQDLGNIFVGGNSGVATKYFNVNTDMGNKLGIARTVNLITSKVGPSYGLENNDDKWSKTFTYTTGLNRIISLNIHAEIGYTGLNGFYSGHIKIYTSSSKFELSNVIVNQSYSVDLTNAGTVYVLLENNVSYDSDGQYNHYGAKIYFLSVTGV